MHVLAVILARANSIGLPNKSLRLLLGRPVIAYTFDHVRQSKKITRTIVSSNDPAILALAQKEGFETLIRPEELATSAAATDPALRHAVNTLYPPIENGKWKMENPHAVLMLYANIPLRNNQMIDRSLTLLEESNCDSVQTIAPVGKFHPYWMFNLTPDARISKHIPNHIFRRQDLPPLYSPTGAVYAIRTPVLMAAENNPDPHAFLGQDRRALLTAPEDSVDIDTEKDLYIAEAMLRANLNSIKPQRHEDTKTEKT